MCVNASKYLLNVYRYRKWVRTCGSFGGPVLLCARMIIVFGKGMTNSYTVIDSAFSIYLPSIENWYSLQVSSCSCAVDFLSINFSMDIQTHNEFHFSH